MRRERLRLLLACLATAALVLPIAWLWWHSRVPSTYSVMSMGYLDGGGGPTRGAGAAHGGRGDGRSPTSPSAPTGTPTAS